MEWIDDPLRPARDELLKGADPTAVVLDPQNHDAAAIYMLTRNQVVTAGMGQPVDISIPAVKIAMDLYEVKDQRACLERVLRVFQHFERIRRDNASS